MSLSTARQSSGSEGDPSLIMDPKKRKRMISNRESARRSRLRKQQRLDDLIKQAAQLQDENAKIAIHINLYTEQYLKIDGDNTILRAQIMELTERLRSLNSVLQFIEEFSGMEMNIPEIPDPLLKPWQLPCPARPVMASVNVLQF